MSDLTRWRRIEMPPEPWTHEDNPEWIFVESHPEPYMLVPDSTLQDIADAWNKGDRFQTATRVHLRIIWPELADLLDAPTQENKTRVVDAPFGPDRKIRVPK